MTVSEVETAYAKINLALHVRGRMDGGYHAIETLFAFVDDGDRLSAAMADTMSLRVIGPFASSLDGDGHDNLVMRAARGMAERFAPGRAAALSLDKHLPVASGIGGGSADAAAAIRLLDRLWGLDRPLQDYAALAASLGADVPACLFSRTALGTGRGDDVAFEEIDGLAQAHILLVNPGIGVSTAQIFQRWNGRDGGALTQRSLAALFGEARNDLQEPAIALVPDIGALLEHLRQCSTFARMSGSGATCFALFESDHDVMAAQAAIADRHPGYWTMTARMRPFACADASPASERAAT